MNPRRQLGWAGSQDSSSTSDLFDGLRDQRRHAVGPQLFWRPFVELEVAEANSDQAIERGGSRSTRLSSVEAVHSSARVADVQLALPQRDVERKRVLPCHHNRTPAQVRVTLPRHCAFPGSDEDTSLLRPAGEESLRGLVVRK